MYDPEGLSIDKFWFHFFFLLWCGYGAIQKYQHFHKSVFKKTLFQ